MVRRLESGRIASMGLQLDELLQVEPDERLLARLEEEADELGPAGGAGSPGCRPAWSAREGFIRGAGSG